MSPCYPFRPIPGQCGPHKRGPLPAPPFDPHDYWATRKLVSSLFGSLDTTKLDKADVVDPSTATEAGKAADAKSTYEELTRIFGMASDAKELAESKADQSALESHVASTDNPHSVTAEQVNAYTKETVDAKLDEKADIVGGKIPASQLPSYVDDVLEYDTMSAFPVTGEGGKIYVAKDTNLTYRWSGTQYVEISPSPLLDDTVTEKSPNGVKSSGIWSWVKSLLPKWLTSDYAEPATVKSVANKADKSDLDAHVKNTNNPHAVTAAQVGAWNLNGANETKAKSQSILIKSDSGETLGSISIGITASGLRLYVSDTGISGGVDASSIAIWPSRISVINGDETVNIRWADIITQKIVQQVFYQNGANAELPVSSAAIQDFWKVVASPEIYTAISGKQDILNPGDDIHVNSVETDSSSSFGNIIIKENNGLAFRGVELSPHGPLERISVFRGKTAFEQVNDLIGSSVSETNPAFSNAVLAVGLNIDTNSVAVLNEIAATFGGFPIGGTATTVGGLLAALAAAVAWLKKNKVGSFESVGGASATVKNGVATLSNFFTGSNSLLAGTIESKVNSMFDNGDTTAYPRTTEV